MRRLISSKVSSAEGGRRRRGMGARGHIRDELRARSRPTSLTNTQEDLSTNAGWTSVYTSSSLSATNMVVTTLTSGLLRYLRWEISAFSGTAISLQISAVART